MKPLSIIYTTLGSKEAAEKLAMFVLEAKLAGCVNIITSVSSLYWWEGKIAQEDEYILLCKTNKPDQLIEFIDAHHPYELPAIIKLDAHTSQEFYDFINAIK